MRCAYCAAPALLKYANELARETARLEEGQRVEGVEEVEITATMVIRSSEAVRRSFPGEVERPRSVRATAIQLFGLVALALAGVMGSYLHGIWQNVVFVFLLLSAIVANAYVIRRRI